MYLTNQQGMLIGSVRRSMKSAIYVNCLPILLQYPNWISTLTPSELKLWFQDTKIFLLIALQWPWRSSNYKGQEVYAKEYKTCDS